MPSARSTLPTVGLVAILFILTSSAFADSIIAIKGPLPAGAHDRLARVMDYYGDYGCIAVGEGDSTVIAVLRRSGFDAVNLGHWNDDQNLHVAELGHLPSGVTQLFRHRNQVLFGAPADRLVIGSNHHVATVHREPWVTSPGFQESPDGILKALAVDPRISALVAQVSASNLQATVTQLSSYHTRRADQPTAVQAKDWLVQQFQAIPGLTVSTDTFDAKYVPNVVAELPGTTHPERVVVLGAHYDSINGSGSTTAAPGADDNASGSAAVLEAARILVQGQFENTIRLVLFSAEEFGLVGAYHDASTLAGSSAQVVAMLNMDMNAYLKSGDVIDINLATNNTDPSLTQFCIDVANAYLPSVPVVTGTLTAGTSDHQAYQSNGIPSAFLFEDLTNWSPHIHSANDVVGISANNFTLAQTITQSFVAAAAELAQPVDMQIAHTPVADTDDTGGPYPLEASVTSLTSDTVTSVDVLYRVDSGAFQTKALIASATPDVWNVSLPGLSPSGTIEYYLLATDTGGNQKWSPEALNPGGSLHRFTVGNLSSIFADDFEGAGENGWTTVQVVKQDDWQKGTPQGKGGYDPGAAASGINARGNDLGIGQYNGIYQSDVDNYLLSPSINCAGKAGVKLRFQRWLSVEDGFYDQATIRVNGQPVWQNPSTPGGGTAHTIDNAWTPQEVDISQYADNNPSVSVRFQLQSDGGLEFGGWTLDDFEVFTLSNGQAADLVASECYLSTTQGGQVDFELDAGVAHGSEFYVLGISATGTSPTTIIDGTPIPLVFDAVTQVGFAFLNTPFFQNFGGTLDPAGTASASLVLPGLTSPTIPGLKLHIAAFTIAPVSYASNPVWVEFGL